MDIPIKLLDSLENIKGFNRESFQKVHQSGEQVTSIRINPSKPTSDSRLATRVSWSHHGYYLPERPSFTFDPLFHAGCYYVQEASSMFIEQALKQTVDLSTSLRVLDLCASPGGKSTHIQSLLSAEGLLVSNETIRGRIPPLQDNIIKWGCENVMITNNDPAHFSSLQNFFDAIVIDAPCSGSGLFRRDPEAIEEWSEHNVQLCSARQHRIIHDAWPALKKDGILIYSTCSYSEEEDELIINYMLTSLNAEYVPLSIEKEWKIVDTGKGYRFWPDQIKGEGFFLAVLRKKDGEERITVRSKASQDLLNKKEIAVLDQWVQAKEKTFIRMHENIYAWSNGHVDEMLFLSKHLKSLYSGLRIGEIIREKLVPDHALAMSSNVSGYVPRQELDYEKAIRYLQRKEINISADQKGWQLITYKNYPLGWANVLPNRINNYYPKELRILKEKL